MIETVKINRFTVLKDFKHDFEGKSVLICGKNALGKSSILKFIRVALGEQGCIAPGIDIDGEVHKNVNGDTYIFSVKMKGGKPVVTVTDPKGLSDSRKGIIASITGAMGFDIDQFVQMSKTDKGRKEQVELFKSFFPKETIEWIEKFEANVKAAFEDRTQLNKDVKAKELEVSTNPLNHLIDKELDKLELVDVTAAMQELKAMQEHNSKIALNIDRKTAIDADVVTAEKALEEMRKQLLEAEKNVAEMKARQKKAVEWMAAPENQKKDTTKLEETISSATKTNKDYESAQKLKADRALLEKMKEEAENATINIESQREEIKKAIKDMTSDMVPGLTFDENGLIYNGLPVHPDTHSTSERIKLGVRMKIAQNKEIGVLFLERLESVDEDGIRAIMEEAEANGMQVLGEEVRRNQGEMTFELIGQ